jgi:hypothetical protein
VRVLTGLLCAAGIFLISFGSAHAARHSLVTLLSSYTDEAGAIGAALAGQVPAGTTIAMAQFAPQKLLSVARLSEVANAARRNRAGHGIKDDVAQDDFIVQANWTAMLSRLLSNPADLGLPTALPDSIVTGPSEQDVVAALGPLSWRGNQRSVLTTANILGSFLGQAPRSRSRLSGPVSQIIAGDGPASAFLRSNGFALATQLRESIESGSYEPGALTRSVVRDFLSDLSERLGNSNVGNGTSNNQPPSPVPLPASFWLLAAAVGGLGLKGYRRKKV